MANDPNVRVRLSTQNEVKTGLDEAEAQIKSFGESIKTFLKNPFVVAAAAIGAMGAALKLVIDDAANLAVELEKTSQMTGISVARLAELSDAAKLSNVPVEDLQTGFKRLAVSMTDTHSKGSQAMKAMGLDVSSFHGDTNAALTAIAQKFSGYQDGAEKSALATAIFGRGGASLIPLLNNLAETTATVRELGASMTGEQQESLIKYEQGMKKLDLAATGFARQVAMAVVPSLDSLSNAFTIQIGDMEKTNVVAELVGGTLRFLATVVLIVKDAFVITGHQVGDVMASIYHGAVGMGKVMVDVAHGDFKQAGRDIKQTFVDVNHDIDQQSRDLVKDLKESGSEIAKLYGFGDADTSKFKSIHKPKAPNAGDEKDKEAREKKEEELEKAKYEYQLKLAEGNYEKISALDAKRLAEVEKEHGKESTQYVQMLQTIEDHTQAHARTLATLKAKASAEETKILDEETKKEIAVLDATYELEIKAAESKYKLIQAIDAKHLADIKIMYGQESAEYIKMLKVIDQHRDEEDRRIEQGKKKQLKAASDVATGIQNIMSAGFANGGSVEAASKEGEKMVLGALGNIMKKQGEAYLAQGSVMTSWVPALAVPATSGVAALAIGAALVGLGSMLGAIDKGGSGGSGGGGGAHGVSATGVNNTLNTMNNSQGTATINIQGGLLDMSNPAQQKAFATALSQLSGRRVVVQSS